MVKNEPVLQAVSAHINLYGNFGELSFTATTDATNFTAGLILVEPIQSPAPTSMSWQGAQDRFEAVVQSTIYAHTLEHARLVADEIRTVLAGKSGRQYAHPLDLPGRIVESVTSNNDGTHDYDARTAQWAERFTIVFQ